MPPVPRPAVDHVCRRTMRRVLTGSIAVRLSVGLFAAAACTPAALGEAWPGWRGPRGDGTSHGPAVPVRWGPEENVCWRVAVPGVGHASPIVHGGRVFLVACDTESQERLLLCYAADSGEQLWRRTVLTTPLEIKHRLNSYASSTPATDGELVYVAFWETDGALVPARNVSAERDASFGRMCVAAYDFAGEQRWIVRPGEFTSCHGFCSCPVVHGNMVIVNGDHDGEGYLVALDRATGRTIWKVPRDHHTRSYVTPLVRTFGGRTQAVLSGSHHVASYDPATGAELWRVRGPCEQFVASLVDDGSRVMLTGGYPNKVIMAIDPTGSGDVTDTHVQWRSTRNCAYVPAPVVVDGMLLLTSDDGVASCYETATGQRLWNARLGTHYSGSPVAAGGLAYFTDDDGVTKVIRPGPTFEVVAENRLGEPTFSSPAVSDGAIYFRTEHHLVRIAAGCGADASASTR
jgi:outer membrane protein assembly factor BamB